MEKSSGIIYGIEARIKSKLMSLGATSKEKALTSKQANFNLEELRWINYIAGGMFAKVKKTSDNRYYILIHH